MHTSIVIRRTSLNLDLELVEAAKGVLGTAGTTETIHRALDEVLRQARLRELVSYRFEIDPDDLEALRTWGGETARTEGADS